MNETCFGVRNPLMSDPQWRLGNSATTEAYLWEEEPRTRPSVGGTSIHSDPYEEKSSGGHRRFRVSEDPSLPPTRSNFFSDGRKTELFRLGEGAPTPSRFGNVIWEEIQTRLDYLTSSGNSLKDHPATGTQVPFPSLPYLTVSVTHRLSKVGTFLN